MNKNKIQFTHTLESHAGSGPDRVDFEFDVLVTAFLQPAEADTDTPESIEVTAERPGVPHRVLLSEDQEDACILLAAEKFAELRELAKYRWTNRRDV